MNRLRDTQALADLIDFMITTWSFGSWQLIATGDRDFWRINGSNGSSIARINEGSD